MPTPSVPLRIMVIGDDPQGRAALTAAVRRFGLTPRTVRSPAAAAVLAGEESFSAALVACGPQEAHSPPPLDGLLRVDPGLRLIVVDSRPSVQAAVHFLKHGAWGYLPYPGRRGAIRRLLSADPMATESSCSAWKEISVTASAAMRRTLADARLAARSEVPVLIRGETGTGKTLLARAIHELSKRRAAALVTVSCASLTSELLVSELFGHVRGAFTDADTDHAGKVIQAEGGTLVLEEIGEMPLAVQGRLLRFLQDRTFERLGDPRECRADVRVLVTTAGDPALLVREGRLREDLYYRLSVIELTLVPLRHRPQDIVSLAQAMLVHLASRGEPMRTLSDECRRTLIAYAWPGNFHQLANELHRALLLTPGAILTTADFSGRLAQANNERPWMGGAFTLQQIANEHIRAIIEGSPTFARSAAILGIRMSTLWHRRRLMSVTSKPPVNACG